MVRAGFEPTKLYALDLKTSSFDHSDISPKSSYNIIFKSIFLYYSILIIYFTIFSKNKHLFYFIIYVCNYKTNCYVFFFRQWSPIINPMYVFLYSFLTHLPK